MTFRIVPEFLSILWAMAVLQTVHGIPACQVQEARVSPAVANAAEHANYGTAGRLQAAEGWTLAGLQAGLVNAL